MASRSLEPLRAGVLWMMVKRFTTDGRSGREYVLADQNRRALLVARAFTWGREIAVNFPDGAPSMSIVRSKAFAFNGKAAVIEAESGRTLGRVSRNGIFSDPAGAVQGRFRDARSTRERARLSLFQGIFEAIFGGDGNSVAPGPDVLVLEVGGKIRGTLSYERIPNDEAEPERDPGSRKLARSVLRARLARAWQSFQQPRAWKLARSSQPDGDPRLEIAAAVFAAELSRW